MSIPKPVREYVAGRLAASLATALVAVAVVRLLPKPEAAALFALLMVYETASVVALAGLPATALVHLSGQAASARSALTRSLFSLALALAAVAALVVAGFASVGFGAAHIESAASPLVPVFPAFIFAFGDTLSLVLPEWLLAQGRSRASAIVGALRAGGLFVAIVLPSLLGMGLGEVVWSLGVLGAAELGVAIVLVLPVAAQHRNEIPGLRPRDWFVQAVPLGASHLVQVLGQQFDRWLVWAMFAADTFAAYRAGAVQIPVITHIAYAFGAFALPLMRQAWSRSSGEEAAHHWRISVERTAPLVVPAALFFVVAAPDVVAFAFTTQYVESTEVFRWYALLTLGRVAWYAAPMLAAAQPRMVLLASIAGLVANVLLSVPLVMWLGAPGAAAGTALAFVPTAAAYVVLGGRALGVPALSLFPLRTFLSTIAQAALAGLAAYGARAAFPELDAGSGLALQGAALWGAWWMLSRVVRRAHADSHELPTRSAP